MKKPIIALLFAVNLISTPRSSVACTAFCLKTAENVVFGFNFDYQTGDGFIFLNKRNVERSRFPLYAESQISWISKYGSITFNVHGGEFPEGGMNEKGLVVTNLGYDEALYPDPDERSSIDEAGWVQYQLDNSSAVEDVIESLKKIRISNRCIATCHYIVTDKAGKSAVIDFINGEVKYYTEGDLPYPILTNDSYEDLLNDIKHYKGFGGTAEIKLRAGSSCSRFNYVANRLKNYDQENNPAIDYAFNILNDCRQSGTQFQIVYDLKNLNLFYYSHHSSKRKTISFTDFEFDCKSPVLITGIQSIKEGNIRKYFFDYKPDVIRKTICKVFKKDFNFIPGNILYEIAKMPDRSNCLSVITGNNGEIKADSVFGLLTVSLPENITISHKAKSEEIHLQIKLNKPANRDMHFFLHVPAESTVIPGKNVFIAPDPITIEKGNESSGTTLFILPERLPSGVDLKLVIQLTSEDVSMAEIKPVIICIKRELPVRPEIVYRKMDKNSEVGLKRNRKSIYFQDGERKLYRFDLVKTAKTETQAESTTSIETYGRKIAGTLSDSISYCEPLNEGITIGPDIKWIKPLKSNPIICCKDFPDWIGKTEYTGVTIRDEITNQLLYGWIKLAVNNDGNITRILSFAYEKNGLPIKTGQRR